MADLRLLVDARPLTHPTAGGRGIGNYTAGLIEGLVSLGADARAFVADDDGRRLAAGLVGPERVVDDASGWLGPFDPDTWFVATGLFLHPISFDAVPRFVTDLDLPVAAIMYDVIPYRSPERYLAELPARRQSILRAALALTVRVHLAISEYSRTTAVEVLGLDPARVTVIGAGAAERFRPGTPPSAPGSPRAVVSVTGGDPRKNTESLIRAWSMTSLDGSAELHLVAAVGRELADRWRALASELGVDRSVRIRTGLRDDEVVALLQKAALVVQPSLDEGFGLPVVEAAACGAPVIASGTTSLAEVIDAVAWFDPLAPASMARAIERALDDADHRAAVIAASAAAAERWTWPRAAAATVRALAAVRPHAGVSIRRVAIASCHADPPHPLVAALRALDQVEIDLIEVGVERGGDLTDEHPHWPLGAFGRYLRAHDYAAVVILDERGLPLLDLARATSRFVVSAGTASWWAAGERGPTAHVDLGESGDDAAALMACASGDGPT